MATAAGLTRGKLDRVTVRPIRCAALVPASEAAVLRAVDRPDVWVRAMRVAGFRLRGGVGETLAGDLAFRADRTRALARSAGLTATDGRPVRVRLGIVDAEIAAVHTAATAAGTLVTLDLRIHCRPPLVPHARKRLLRWGEDLLGIIAVTARDLQVVVAGAVIDDAGRVLAARRIRPAEHRGGWELPGGKVEPGESERQALYRELVEELGIEVEVLDPLPVVVPLGDTAVLRTYRCRHRAGVPVPQGADRTHDEVRWVPGSELSALDWLPADKPLLAYLAPQAHPPG